MNLFTTRIEATALSAAKQAVLGDADEKGAAEAVADACERFAAEATQGFQPHQLEHLAISLITALGSLENIDRPAADGGRPAGEDVVAGVARVFGLAYGRLAALPSGDGGSQLEALNLALDVDDATRLFLDLLGRSLSVFASPVGRTGVLRLALAEAGFGIFGTADEQAIRVEYLVSQSIHALARVVRGDISQVPGSPAVLAPTPILDEWREMINRTGGDRSASVLGEYFDTKAAFLAVHHDADVPDPSGPWSGYESVRAGSPSDVRRAAERDPITGLLDEAGVPAESLVAPVGFTPVCGDIEGEPFAEELELRPVWAVMLVVTALEDGVQLEQLIGTAWEGGLGSVDSIDALAPENGRSVSLPLARAELAAGSRVLIPVGTVLPPLGYLPDSVTWSTYDWVADDGSYRFAEVVGELGGGFERWGSYVQVEQIAGQSRGEVWAKSPHVFDAKRMYVIDHGWGIGSCPYLFARTCDGVWRFVRDLFARSPGLLQTELVPLPAGTTDVLIAELECEVSTIGEASYAGVVLCSDLVLGPGDRWAAQVGEGVLALKGSYLPEWHGPPTEAHDRNVRVASFLDAIARDAGRASATGAR